MTCHLTCIQSLSVLPTLHLLFIVTIGRGGGAHGVGFHGYYYSFLSCFSLNQVSVHARVLPYMHVHSSCATYVSISLVTLCLLDVSTAPAPFIL